MRCSRELAQKEGIFVGITAGATFSGALKVCAEAPAGANVLCMLPDTGERYLCTPLFADVPAEMTDEELAIARSTPNYRFDVSRAGAAPRRPLSAPAPVDSRSRRVRRAGDRRSRAAGRDVRARVVRVLLVGAALFAVRDPVSLDRSRLGRVPAGRSRRQDPRGAHRAHAIATIPQIFVGGEFLGGATDVLQAAKDGRLQQLLEASHVTFDTRVGDEPLSFLPSWLHPR